MQGGLVIDRGLEEELVGPEGDGGTGDLRLPTCSIFQTVLPRLNAISQMPPSP